MSTQVFDEFEEWLARVFHASAWSALTESASLQQHVSLLDQDGDGDLDDDDVDELFDECDTNLSGSVTVDELALALGKRLSKKNSKAVALKMRAIADADRDGHMSREELHDGIRKIAWGDGESMGALCFERAFEVWLRDTFLPAAQEASTQKKKKVAV